MRDILNIGTFANEFCTLTLICFSTINSLRHTRLTINAVLFERFTAPSFLNVTIPLRTVVCQLVVFKDSVKWLQFEISLAGSYRCVGQDVRGRNIGRKGNSPWGPRRFLILGILTFATAVMRTVQTTANIV